MYSPQEVNRLMKDGFCPSETMGISVVVPIGPGESEDALGGVFDSIAGQTYKGPVQVIAVCNGAPSGLYEFAKGRADKTINAGNPLGYSGARNAGIEAAKYGIVVCVDADTRIANSDIFEKAEASVKSGCVGGMTNTVPDKETCGEGAFYGWTSMAGRYLTPLMNIPFIRDYIPTVGNGQFMYFRNGLGLRFDESLGSQEDVGFVDTMRECGKVGFIDSGQIVTSGRRFRKDGPALSWFNRAKRWLNYTNGETSALATAPAPVMA